MINLKLAQEAYERGDRELAWLIGVELDHLRLDAYADTMVVEASIVIKMKQEHIESTKKVTRRPDGNITEMGKHDMNLTHVTGIEVLCLDEKTFIIDGKEIHGWCNAHVATGYSLGGNNWVFEDGETLNDAYDRTYGEKA